MTATYALRLRHVPNLISALRIVLVAPLLAAIATRRDEMALVIAVVAGVSDGLDGYLARRFHWQSRLGSILDPAADKLMLVGAMLVLGLVQAVPMWLVVLVVARDAVIAGGAVAWYAVFRRFEAHPSWISKLTTVVQIGYVLLVLASHALAVWVPLAIAGWIVAVLTPVSGLDYVLRWGRLAWRGLKTGRPA
ncbi:MAG TPA: CDP-alcohol phosphatidyltransferase family protein [Rhodanobacteraceae bacterium]|nr:CDP-alcohol phosphatidyltransferase family protein [Rhodanobacteraceae bacterium]